MTLKQQKLISTILISIVAFGGLEILAYIINLNQPVLFTKAAFAIYLYLVLKITLLYDLHFKRPGALKRAQARHESISHWLHRSVRVVLSAFWDRISHLRKKHHFLQFQNYLILPGFLFWSTVILLYINMGNRRLQQIFVLLSGGAIVVVYWYLKEAFLRKTEKVDRDIFAALGAVKVFAAAIVYAGFLAILRRFCLEPNIFTAGIFSLTFLLMYQALFQHKLIDIKNIAWTLLISAVQALLGYFVYRYWGYNFYTAGILMAAIYNLMWGTFHYHLDKALSRRVFFEILLICAVIALMVLSVTNFKARLLDGCLY